MPHGLAFLPWIAVKNRTEIGPLTLLPYRLGIAPGDLPGVTQAQMDSVLSAYWERPHHPIREATIVELHNWRSGSDPAQAIRQLFDAREALAFSALSNRRLFLAHLGYYSFDTFALIVQTYSATEPELFAYVTRRRDGGTHNLWSANEFVFHQPPHVHKATDMHWDDKLLSMLLRNDRAIWRGAIFEFNRANTDSPDVPTHVEMNMVKSAFERLFEINQSAANFERALLSRIREPASEDASSRRLLTNGVERGLRQFGPSVRGRANSALGAARRLTASTEERSASFGAKKPISPSRQFCFLSCSERSPRTRVNTNYRHQMPSDCAESTST